MNRPPLTLGDGFTYLGMATAVLISLAILLTGFGIPVIVFGLGLFALFVIYRHIAREERFSSSDPAEEEEEKPFEVPFKARFQHTWILGTTGSGKTTLLTTQIARDLERVATGGASVILMDSEAVFMKAVARSSLFAEGGRLHGKLVLIDAADSVPIALNLFDLGLRGLAPEMRRRQINATQSILKFFLNSLLTAGLTSRQTTLFDFTLRLLFEIPGATIHTFRQIMGPNGLKGFEPYIDKLGPTARDYFANKFGDGDVKRTRGEVADRLYAILRNEEFNAMFSSPANKIDFAAEMNAGKVIIINTARGLLGKENVEILGRFFIALIAQAAAQRPEDEERCLPTFVYVDECQDYLYRDENIEDMLEKVRKKRIGLILSHHFMGRLSAETISAFTALTTTIYAGQPSTEDLPRLSRIMQTPADFIQQLPRYTFALFVRGLTSTSVPYRADPDALSKHGIMSDAQFEAIRVENRRKYAVDPKPSETKPAASPATNDNVDTDAEDY